MNVYEICILLLNKNKIENLQEKLDIYFAASRLSADQYVELTNKLQGMLTAVEIEE